MRTERLEGSGYEGLVHVAIEGLDRAYAPYSNYHVGAGLEDREGKIWLGCNIENSAYPVCNCGERTALFKAISEGVKNFKALAVVGRKGDGEGISRYPASPCGVCRQALSEFCPMDMPVVLAYQKDGEVFLDIYSLDELLPGAFDKEKMGA